MNSLVAELSGPLAITVARVLLHFLWQGTVLPQPWPWRCGPSETPQPGNATRSPERTKRIRTDPLAPSRTLSGSARGTAARTLSADDPACSSGGGR